MINITIALTRYQEPDELVRKCLLSIAAQKNVQVRVCFLDQSFHQQTKNVCEKLSSEKIIFEYHLIPAQGCAYARNIAIGLCQTDTLLWTDPDMVHSPDWGWNLACALRDHASEIVGGKILPLWHTRPRWYMTTNVMADHYSLIDLGEDTRITDRIIGGSMGPGDARRKTACHESEKNVCRLPGFGGLHSILPGGTFQFQGSQDLRFWHVRSSS